MTTLCRAAALVVAVSTAPCASAHTETGLHQEPILYQLMIDRLELLEGGGDPLAWQAGAWIGNGIDKAWLKSRGTRVDGSLQRAEWQLLYNRAITPFWDGQVGWRYDARPQPHRHWLALGVHGLAPWFVELDATLFLGEGGQTGLRIEAEYEFRITSRLKLIPEVELDAHGRDDPRTLTGEGLSRAEAGLRLGYDVAREFMPYVGVEWHRSFGPTADMQDAAGDARRDRRVMLGLRAWY